MTETVPTLSVGTGLELPLPGTVILTHNVRTGKTRQSVAGECSAGWSSRCAAASSLKCTCGCGGVNHGKAPGATGAKKRNQIQIKFKMEKEDMDALPDIMVAPKIIRLWRGDFGVPMASVEHKWVSHSPDGFEWGYAGSGPAELALNILILFVSRSEAWRLHQAFKVQFIVPMPSEGGAIKAEDIQAWIDIHPRITIHPEEKING